MVLPKHSIGIKHFTLPFCFVRILQEIYKRHHITMLTNHNLTLSFAIAPSLSHEMFTIFPSTSLVARRTCAPAAASIDDL